ncbi:thiamine pyrophosphate-dependent enzyme [Cryobacterium sp. TMT1-66-1]|uniref:thiamine pyrophosphate-dependent enzyme n=1 Tax=Cryobacterium sp. TMT1-66-1 TaxID=1259242 RepID=UPI0010694249|nr:thiamine pyrophosphate-dependent enzyme [Cryobacterium sp. TMT1-66-1]TFD10321.1 thiamine pyrophosphate-binding protein [Cryobacterium sp. TMT1-66-1]
MSAATATVRDACFDVMRAEGLTTIFSNPGSTEIPFLVDLPEDIQFVLALHEGSVVGIAAGHALGSGSPAFVLLHTTAGFGNAVGAIATARVNRAPMVVVVGQQDRRHLALEPFLAGRLAGLAGDYPLEVISPVIAADVPSAIRRAIHLARQERGPVIVIVPMDDWDEPADPTATAAASHSISAPRGIPTELENVVTALRGAAAPAIIAGSGNDNEAGWAALVQLAESLHAPVWQEAFGSRAGFPQDHPLFRGSLPADRPRVREALNGHDVLLVVGTAALRQYPYKPGSLVPNGMRVFVLTADASEANRSPAELSIIGDPAALCSFISTQVGVRSPLPAVQKSDHVKRHAQSYQLDPPTADEPLRAAHVFQLLAERLPIETTVVEESPSSRPALEALIPARRPFGFLSAAMGGLGFAMPAAIGLKMAQPDRPVIGIIGDGSSMYSIQSLWTAANLGVGVVFIVLNNGGYAVMNRLADQRGGAAPWPSFGRVSVSAIAAGLGVEALKIDGYSDLVSVLDRIAPSLAGRQEALVLEVIVTPDVLFLP